MSDADSSQPDFDKGDGLLPAVAQDADTGAVLMLAYMGLADLVDHRPAGKLVAGEGRARAG